jgi:hypothetical protein
MKIAEIRTEIENIKKTLDEAVRRGDTSCLQSLIVDLRCLRALLGSAPAEPERDYTDRTVFEAISRVIGRPV